MVDFGSSVGLPEALKAAVAAQRQDPQAASNHLIWFPGERFGVVCAFSMIQCLASLWDFMFASTKNL